MAFRSDYAKEVKRAMRGGLASEDPRPQRAMARGR
jgi:hypothetical protein